MSPICNKVTCEPVDLLNHRTKDENNWLDNVVDSIKQDNDNFKPCIATLKFDKSVPFIYNLYDNIPCYNFEDENHHKLDVHDALVDVPASRDYFIGGEIYHDDPNISADAIPPDIDNDNDHNNNIINSLTESNSFPS